MIVKNIMKNAVSDDNQPKYSYSNDTLKEYKENLYSFVKPLSIVRIWRRKVHSCCAVENPENSPSSVKEFYKQESTRESTSSYRDFSQGNSPYLSKRSSHQYLQPCSPYLTRESSQKYTPNNSPKQIRDAQQEEFQKAGEKARTILSKGKADPFTPILNKLTPINQSKLQDQLFEIAQKSDLDLQVLVEKIFQKACLEKKYTKLWASVCRFLSKKYKSLQEIRGSKEKEAKNKFKTALLNISQNFFESFETSLDLIENLKKKNMGNISFIGELFKIKIIPQKTIIRCLLELLSDDQNGEINEGKIEGAYILLMSCRQKCERFGESLDIIIEKIQKIIESNNTSSRIKCLLLVIHI